MTNQQLIMNLVTRELERANVAYREAHASVAAAIAGSKVWLEYNQQDGVGGFSLNPWRVEDRQREERRCLEHLEQIKAAHAFALETFLGDPLGAQDKC